MRRQDARAELGTNPDFRELRGRARHRTVQTNRAIPTAAPVGHAEAHIQIRPLIDRAVVPGDRTVEQHRSDVVPVFGPPHDAMQYAHLVHSQRVPGPGQPWRAPIGGCSAAKRLDGR
jgi:hypothetical protein